MTQSQLITATIFDKRGKILAVGKNSYHKTHPMQFKLACKCGNPNRPYLHAEIDAIRRLKKNAQYAYRILIERYYKNGSPALAKPCKSCELAIKQTPIRIITFTT